MHPFSLTDEQLKQVSGGASLISRLPGGIVSNLMLEGGQVPAPGPIVSPRKPVDEELTTMALGEEGGLPPGYLA